MAKAKLGSVVSSVRGSLGGLVVLDGRYGTVVKSKPTYRRPTSPAQRLVEARMRAASAAWSSMNAAQVARWRAWGEGRGRTAQTAFVGLATKFLQVNPSGSVPLVPPTAEFIADDVAVRVTSSFHSGERKGPGDRESGLKNSALSPQPPLSQAKEGEPGLLFTATGANRPGTVTELLIQPLLNERRSPGKDYKTAAFVGFTAAQPTSPLPVAPGSYAVGYRFVERSTGLQSPAILLGVVQV